MSLGGERPPPHPRASTQIRLRRTQASTGALRVSIANASIGGRACSRAESGRRIENRGLGQRSGMSLDKAGRERRLSPRRHVAGRGRGARAASRVASVVETDQSDLEEAILAGHAPGVALIGTSVSPDGRYATGLVYLESADCLLDEVVARGGNGVWLSHYGGSGGGMNWTSLSDDARFGVLRFADEAPPGATVARVAYEGAEHVVPVRHGHFLFVAWDTDFHEDPQLLGFE